MINVFIADDHLMVREGLKRIIAEQVGMQISGEAVDSNQLLEILPTSAETDILLLDISMPGAGFLETLRRLNRHFSHIKILILSAHSEEQYAKRAFKAGAKGYLTKNHSPDELICAINRIYSGGKYISESLAEKLAFDMDSDNTNALHESLSQREYQILTLLGNGKTVGEIAKDLSLSPKTVSTYRTRLLEKMQLNTTSELIHYAIKQGIAE